MINGCVGVVNISMINYMTMTNHVINCINNYIVLINCGNGHVVDT